MTRSERKRITGRDVEAARERAVEREQGLCRAWIDGQRFPWCEMTGTDFHEEAGARGMGGRRPGSVTIHNSILICHGCHMAHHGVNAPIHITIRDAEERDGVEWKKLRPFKPRAVPMW